MRMFPAICCLLLTSAGLANAETELDQLSRAMRESPRVETVLPLLPKISLLLWDDETAYETLPAVEQAADILLPSAAENGEWTATASLLKIAARMRFDQAEPDKAAKHLQSLRGLYHSLGERLLPETAGSQRSRWSKEVALEYLRGEQTNRALELLGEAIDRQEQIPQGFDEVQAAVAGALNRRLEQLRTNERYELLYAWTMPGDGRRTVRVMTSLASVEAPPDVFARAIGERPRANAFPVPKVNAVNGLFSTAWSLVRAAAESGRLRRLTTELEDLAKTNVPHADHILLLAHIADDNSNADELRGLIDKRLETLGQMVNARAPAEQPGVPQIGSAAAADDLRWVVVGAACLQRQEMRVAGQQVFERLLELIDDGSSPFARPFLRRARAIAILEQHEGADSSLLADPNLKFWIPASEENAMRSASGAVREIWLAHEDHILHLAGPHNDYLCFRYPLTGEFDFQVEAQNGGQERTFGNLAFGGLAYGVAGNADEFRVWGLDMHQMITRPFPFVRKEPWPTYQRLALRSSDKGVQHVVNGHPVWSDPLPQSTSPWLALRCSGDYIPAFRNFRLTGNPTIPREVRMSDGNLLRGWFTQFYPSNVSRAVPLDQAAVTGPITPVDQSGSSPSPQGQTQYDWFVRDGVIYGTQRSELFRAAVPSRLAYFRPLQSEEAISYEFLYEPGEHEVHPALGRLVFFVEPNGVRVRWMTTGEAEWTGLAEDNATLEPLSRRGPRPLPLKSGDWNRVTMALNKDTLSLTLNDVEIYSRKMEADNSRRFSFYHDRNRAAVQVRNVVLRGDWPEQLTDQERKDLLAPLAKSNGPHGESGSRSLGATFHERHVTDTALAIHRQAAVLPPDDRFTFLANYVLPGTNHDTLRLSLEFTPTNPPPVITDQDSIGRRGPAITVGDEHTRSRVQLGGNLVSPAFDLVDVARQLGRLDEVRRRIVAAPQATDLQQRQRLAMLALIDIARTDFASANDLLFQLFALVEPGTHTEFAERWPETLAADAALRQSETRQAGREMAIFLHFRQARNGADSGSEAWRRHIASLVGLARYFDEAAEPSVEKFTKPPPLKQWSVVSRETARSRGFGFPRVHWQLDGARVDSLSRHDQDYLYFQSPLHGDYEVEGDVPAFGWRDLQVMVAGEWVAARYDLKSYSHGNFRRVLSYEEVTPPFVKPSDWIHYRVVVRDGAVKHFSNGRLLHERQLEQHADPWLALRSDTPGHSGAKNVSISGQPEIPDVIQLANTDGLGGWLAYYNTQSVGSSQANWRQYGDPVDGGGIVGRHQPELAGSFAESLLRYHRPMLEDGTIEYEFYYRAGESLCHPALDRLAFLLAPSGVRTHWITDANYDRTELAADNLTDEPENRRGPEPLPLTNNAWNRLALTLQGDVVQLSLNGQLIYERELEPTNQRTFGLFHYADQTEAQVRAITWRGDWPRVLPAIADQELSGDHPTFLEKTLPELPAKFEHDFALEGFPMNKFSIVYGTGETFTPLPVGLHVDHRGNAGYRNATFAPRLSIHGDFDITATYEQLDTVSAPDGSASLYLLALLNNEQQNECMVMRRHALRKRGADQQFHQTALVRQEPQGERRHYSRARASETRSGRLRLARRGSTVYFLHAEGDSPLFQLERTEELTADEIATGELRVINQTHGPGRVQVVWKSLSIRATKLETAAQLGIVAELDGARAALPTRFAHDFTRARMTPDRFHQWGFDPPSVLTREGMIVSGPPNDNWTSAGAAPQVALRGDFDISFDFDLLRMTAPKEGMSSSVYLQLETPGEAQQQYNVILVGSPDGGKYISAQLREKTPEGNFNYPSISREFVENVQRLRLARRGTQLYFLFSEDTSQPDRLLASHEIAPLDIPSAFVRVLVHTGGVGKITETAWKNFSINAE